MYVFGNFSFLHRTCYGYVFWSTVYMRCLLYFIEKEKNLRIAKIAMKFSLCL